MKYTIDERGIHYQIEDQEADAQAEAARAAEANAEPPPIPLPEAVATVERVAEKIRDDLERCVINGSDGSPEPRDYPAPGYTVSGHIVA